VAGEETIKSLFENAGFDNVGTADSGFTRYWQDALKLFPDAKLLIVRRDPMDAWRSTQKFLRGVAHMPPRQHYLDLNGKLDELAKAWPNEQLFGCDFEALNDPKDMLEISSFIGIPFSLPRFHELNDLRIEVFRERAIEQAQKSNMVKLLPQSSIVTPLHEQYNLMLKEMCGNTPGAFQWLSQLWDVIMTWDHIVDGDELDLAKADRAFENMLLIWPGNPFWNQNAARLIPVLINAVAAWRYANNIGDNTRAYDVYTEVPCTVAAIIGGAAAVRKYSTPIRVLVDKARKEDDLWP